MHPNVKTLLLNEMTPEYFRACYKSTNAFVIGIPKEFIESMNMQFIDAWMHTIRTCSEAKDCKFLITTQGYEDDPREVYQVPMICDYIIKVFTKYPELYYFLDREMSIWVPAIIASDMPLDKRKVGKVEVNLEKYANFLIAGMNRLITISYLSQEDIKRYADNTDFYNITRSAFSAHSNAFVTPMLSTTSEVSRIPAVSTSISS